MQWLAASLISIYVFILCINGAFYWISTELENAGVILPNSPLHAKGSGFEQQGQNFNSTINSFEGGAGFNPTFIFGDFGKGITAFFQIVSGGYLMQQLGLFGFPQSFQIFAQVIVLGFLGAGTAIYYISGRS